MIDVYWEFVSFIVCYYLRWNVMTLEIDVLSCSLLLINNLQIIRMDVMPRGLCVLFDSTHILKYCGGFVFSSTRNP